MKSLKISSKKYTVYGKGQQRADNLELQTVRLETHCAQKLNLDTALEFLRHRTHGLFPLACDASMKKKIHQPTV